MRPGSFSESSPSDRPKSLRGRGRGPAAARQIRRKRQATLESLEPKILLATIPSPAVVGNLNISTTGEDVNESTPTIVVNPTNSNHLVASWTVFDQTGDEDFVLTRIRMSTDGGLTWTNLAAPGLRIDPNSGDDPAVYPDGGNASVAFARDGSFYLLSMQNNGLTAGELILRHYGVGGNVISTENVYEWNRSVEEENQTAVSHPVLAVDSNLGSPGLGNVYVSFIGDTEPPDGATNWNPLTVDLIRSTDQGLTFSGRQVLNNGGNGGAQRNTTPRLAVSGDDGRVVVVWDDFGSGAEGDPPFSIIRSRRVAPDGAVIGGEVNVGTTLVRGNAEGGGQVASVSNPRGIGAAPSIAIDNTDGGQNQGRIYVAFTSRINNDDNPADNTDIALAFSDNGGASWTIRGGRVNDDLAIVDGFSEGSNVTGRPQYMPEVAVDQATGTLLVQYYDARHDAARARVATTLAASIDGGSTFAPQVFVNPSETAFDVATGQFRVVGPIPDNQSGGNPLNQASFAFGTRQGLAVLGGNVYSARSGNLNGGPNALSTLDIHLARATMASGPRIVEGSSGVVTTTDMNGTPEARWFDIEFDRPIDVSTFSTSDVEVLYQPLNGSATVPVPVSNITQTGSTTFRVFFDPQTAPGSYMYAVGSDIRDLLGNLMDQDANAVPDVNQSIDVRFSVPRTVGGVAFATPARDALPLIVPGPRVVSTQAVSADGTPGNPSHGRNLILNGTVGAFRVTFDRDMLISSFTPEDVLSIVGPGGQVDPASITVEPVGGNDEFARTFEIGFDVQELSGTYQLLIGSNIQSSTGHLVDSNQNAGVDVVRGGEPGGPTVAQQYNSPAGTVPLPAGQTTTAQIVLPNLFSNDFTIEDLNLQLNITHPNVPDLTATLIAPDGTRVLLFSGVGDTGSRANFTNTIFDDQADLPISTGSPPFGSRFQPQGFLGDLNGSNSLRGPEDLDPNGVYTLEIVNAGGIAGSLNNWNLTFEKRVPGTGLGEPVADRIESDFRIFTMDPTDGLSSSTWTPVGPASQNNGGGSGRVTGLAIDPSDPSGNTVYAGSAAGGVWKSNNFLTTAPGGPTWIPLLDETATFGLNTGGVSVFGRNNDPNQSVIFVSTGEGSTFSRGVGILRSLDGGRNWELLDSLDNTLPFADRGHEFIGLTSFDVVVDPRPRPDGQAIVYAAFSGTGANPDGGGVYRSLDSGSTWQLVRAGQATSITLDPTSGTVDAFTNPTGNLLNVFAAFRGDGVYLSPTQGNAGSWQQMVGGVGKPNLLDLDPDNPVPLPVAAPPNTPNGAHGRIVLAKPSLTGDARLDFLTSGWLYAVVATPDGRLHGLFQTKDYGANWTRLRLPTFDGDLKGIPSNDTGRNDFDMLGDDDIAQGNFDIALTVNPVDPNIVYVGGFADYSVTRVDATNVHDPHAFYLSSQLPDGGQRRNFVPGPVTVEPSTPEDRRELFPFGNDPRTTATINLLRNPNDVTGNATLGVNNAGGLSNSGAGVTWTPWSAVQPILNGVDVPRLINLVDPVTGRGRIIVGYDQGISTVVDDGTGGLITSVGSTQVASGVRNGNIQISKLYFGATQPSNLAAQLAGALFYGQAQDTGFPRSSPDVLETGNLNWSGGFGDGTGVATDQTGSGTAYYYNWPCCGGRITDFFQVDLADGNPNNGIGRTTGLLQQSGTGQVPDPQWPFLGGANFAVNPINNREIVIAAPGSTTAPAGRIFRTVNQGLNWFPIRQPDGPAFNALAFGAPADPTAGTTADHIFAGDESGRIFVTYNGGASWNQINNGAFINRGAVRSIVPNPTPGSFEAYAVTTGGVFHIPDTRTGEWRDITANLFQITHEIFGNADMVDTLLKVAQTLAVDWRYAIPDDFDNPPVNPTDPDLTHPVLYIGGQGGVFSSYDDGGTWNRFPSAFANSINTTPENPGDGGGLPVADVRDLDLALGHVERTTGLPRAVSDNGAVSPDLLVATTYGRGAFTIRLAPVVFPDSLRLVLGDARLPINPNQVPEVNLTELVFEGFSAQSAFGNTITIRAFLIDEDGNFDLESPLPTIGTPTTDSSGRFRIEIDTTQADVLGEDGPKRIGIQAIDTAGVSGNIAVYDLILDTIPPEAPIILDLQPGSDSGFSDSDNYTNAGFPPIAAPVFNVGPVLEVGLTLELFRNNVLVASMGEVTPEDSVAITDNDGGTGVPDGTYTYFARLVDRAGNVSGNSPNLVVTIDTVSPGTPTVPVLLPADDSGVPGDGITNVRQPRFSGSMDLADNELSTENLPLVQIISGSGVVLGQARVNPDGSYLIQLAVPLADGVYVLQARAMDRAGNVSDLLPGQSIRIDTSLPPGVTLGLSPLDDTGPVGDNITRIQRPRLIGSTGAGLQVELIDVAGNVPGGGPGVVVAGPVISQPDGAYTLQIPTDLPDGTYTLVARVTNVAGNTIDSIPLELTILTEAGVGIPTLRLAPESDTGFQGDGRTTVRRPFFVGEGAGPNTVVDIVGPGGALLATGTTNDDGTYRLQLPSNLANGTIVLRARFRGASGVSGPFSAPLSLTIESLTGDFNNNGRADRALYRPGTESEPSAFYLDRTTGGNSVIDSAAFRSNDPSSPLFGFELRPTDLPLTGDFDGDGVADVAIFRPESDRAPGASEWFILGSRTGPRAILFGGAGLDAPAVGDFDGDGITDIAVFRPVSDLLPGAAEWFILPSSTGQGYRVSFGAAGGLDLPAVADFDGDGRAEIAVFRPSSDLFPGEAQWFILPSSSNDLTFSEMRDGYSVRFGQAGVDQPVPLDYDGDNRADIATYRPTTSEWFIYRSGLPFEQAGLRVEFGQPGDIPAPGDYDGDGIADLAYFRPSNGEWTIRDSSLGTDRTTNPFGIAGDIPLLSPLAYRDPRIEVIGSPIPASASSVAQAGRTAGSTLDLGGQAARLNGGAGTLGSAGSAVRSPSTGARAQRLEARAQALADAADRQRVLRGDAGDRPVTGLRSLLADFWARRLGNRPRA